MTFAMLSNILTMMFCAAVLVQSVRMIRCLRAVKGVAFGTMVAALDTSTAEARAVLADLRETLRVDCAANARVIATGTAMREELTVMAGIADAVAERIVEAVGKTTPPRATPRTKVRARPVPQSASETPA
ncbi:hypothetical protein U1839_06870 [Sphingomonas sp. RT2P30]|uniref:hypothetical protein n=1 Tax=Parasphingomonas halimpatiens TaxID=3096162 RepID=UPI002FCB3FC1